MRTLILKFLSGAENDPAVRTDHFPNTMNIANASWRSDKNNASKADCRIERAGRPDVQAAI